MTRTSPLTATALLVVILRTATPAIGASNYATTSQLPPVQTQGIVTYLSGGIGQTEAVAMRREETSFPLSFEFVERTQFGAKYLAGVNVTIKDHEGKTVLSAVADGPLLLANLPDGEYTVTADDNGRAKTRKVSIAQRKREHVVFEW